MAGNWSSDSLKAKNKHIFTGKNSQVKERRGGVGTVVVREDADLLEFKVLELKV